MLSNFFKRKPAKKKTVTKAPKKAPLKSKKATTPSKAAKPAPKPLPPAPKPLSANLLKSNKIITAEGWNRMVQRRSSTK